MERIASILAAAIDAKSPWTAGHSQRVEKYAVALGREIGMPDSELEEISISATPHVIGKIGIDERILDKPARLTEEEYALVRTHPETGGPSSDLCRAALMCVRVFCITTSAGMERDIPRVCPEIGHP